MQWKAAAAAVVPLLLWAVQSLAQPAGLDAFKRPAAVPFPEAAPYSREIATLGKMLFFDPRLSGGQNISCSSCHNPSFGWETPVPKAIGAANKPVRRHAPTLLNAAWITPLFWDGRADSLETQAIGPITAPDEMNATFDGITARLTAVHEYKTWFDRLFPGRGIRKETVLTALATYQRTIVSGVASFDRWVSGDATAVPEAAKRGFALFNGRANCVSCHSGWMFTDNQLHDIGIQTTDLGGGGLTPPDPEMNYRFKTPGLRNIALRAPYMHDGSLTSLREVVRHYADGGSAKASRMPDIEGFAATEADITDLIAFLQTLTDTGTNVPTPILPAN
ncbi:MULTISPECIES: cytochrome-c peroxidase [unclassified Leisingera]|uniref:cytochrome-c peroxidase n=1 Tax=unclassified Leisingera TaxID=2614906 RepID=UPI0010117681|nr:MULTISPECIES: cytochrome c peroxidase [unclassified Leisingera]MCF6432714.1 c-type cytochrome [Leisingera sp. MMG026]QAX30610.1 c-type cytochrome [Leisingera sp. NJS204]